MVFYKKSGVGYRQVMEGIRLKTLVHGEKTLLCEFRIKKGKALPSHSHPHEQTGYLFSGHMKFIIGDNVFEAEPGDSWCIPGDVEHAAEAFEDSMGVEVFSPVREEYLP
jgi:quercetin dioxygenase-like cupin family protein